MQEYEFLEIEKKWQKYWADKKIFQAEETSTKPKYFVMDMFPYPSGDGLHVGHVENYTATDIMARYKRHRGFNVLYAMGWDAFGLPAEQFAIKKNTHPRESTGTNIINFKRQMRSVGLSHELAREINTTDESYMKWTQWMFKQLYNKGLAYESFESVNWCEELGTVLANEEVIDGVSEIGSFPVVKKKMRQWVLKITEYADRLIDDLDDLDWPEHIKEMQRNWIGRSYGADVNFKIENSELEFTVFTTRPDTLFGATFCVLAPEHELVSKITTKEHTKVVNDYIKNCANKTDLERTDLNKDKNGVFTGAYALNPVNDTKIPVYIADYVLVSYGHGAIMAVPAHDERDHEFACKYKIPIKRVLTGGNEDINAKAHTGDGELVNSDFLNGLDKKSAIEKVTKWLVEKNHGSKTINFRLRDWLFSRQRFWGEPFPLAQSEDGEVILIDDEELPIKLPHLDNYKPAKDGEPPLSKAKEWLRYEKDGKVYKRETNTMPQWAGSCWYYLRYIDPQNDETFCDKSKEKYWMPVDLYIGGVEHAVLHLLYSRFWHKVMYDCGLVSGSEPFKKLVNQGFILCENNEKMSKSKGNVVNPDEVITEWGADSVRLYEMFLGPLEASKVWKTKSIVGVNRFLKRVWRLFVAEDGSVNSAISAKESAELKSSLHKTIKKVTEDTNELRYNTAISAMMEYINQVYKEKSFSRESALKFLILLSPYAPHICEELWQKLGNKNTLAYESWPIFDKSMIVVEQTVLVVQINGKVRAKLEIDLNNVDKIEIMNAAKDINIIKKYLEESVLVKEIYVPGKIINFVVKNS